MGHSDTYTPDCPYNLKLNRGENKSTNSLHNVNNINIRHRRKKNNLKSVKYPIKKLISYYSKRRIFLDSLEARMVR